MKSIDHLPATTSRLWAAALTSAVLGAATLSAQAGASSTTPARSTTEQRADKLDRSDRKFIEKAAKSNHKEMALSELASERATNQEVRSFAQQIVTDHAKASQDLMQLAHSKGVTMEEMGVRTGSATAATTATTRAGGTTTAGTTTGTTGPATGAGAGTAGPAGSPDRYDSRVADLDDGDVKKLSKESGRDFDERYVKLMVKEHEDAVKLFEETAKDAKDPEIRTFAAQHVGALRQHLQQAKNLERTVAE